MFKFLDRSLTGPGITDSTLDLARGGGSGPSVETRPAPLVSASTTVEKVYKGRLSMIAPILISVIFSIVGQLILKRGMSDLGPVSLTGRNILDTVWAIALNPYVIVGMIIFVTSFLLWLVGLSRVPLSYAYPFISLSYVVILAASYFLLGEPISLLRLLGVVVICAGVIVVALS